MISPRAFFFNQNQNKMNGGTPSNEPWGVHCSPEPGRKFLPLGSVSHRAISKGLHQTTTKSPSVFTTSFVSREQPTTPSLSPLPDIYTTCPELRQFKPLMTLPEMNIHQTNYSNATNSQFLQNNQPPSLSSGVHLANDTQNLEDQKPIRFPENSDFDPNEQILKPYVFEINDCNSNYAVLYLLLYISQLFT